MKYFLNGTWVNDLTLEAVPVGATVLTDEQWNARQPAPQTPIPKTKAQRIEEVLLTQAEGRDRTTVQLAILIGEMVLAPYAAQLYSVSLEIALMGVYARNKTYRLCKDAETAIEAIEDEP
ncbi:MAG: hypothetical protein Q7U63_12080 [Polaromonas sp.]|uniref:hypothetical protein n=1 Tax=Polaromonas sp. TaxID=1869339 RepID=UPI00272330C0|nr:hypothetical protein [Polaromonas sp.]MDO9114515.1 hypothetical protein [Polaromonas sp.]MDP3615594.1 hypothetical protein [Rubrivivax sp.]